VTGPDVARIGSRWLGVDGSGRGRKLEDGPASEERHGFALIPVSLRI
jgi:hypothetical protein